MSNEQSPWAPREPNAGQGGRPATGGRDPRQPFTVGADQRASTPDPAQSWDAPSPESQPGAQEAPSGRHGSQPLGQQPLPSQSIQDYALPRSRVPVLLWALAAILVLALVGAGFWWNARPQDAAPVATPSSTQAPPTTQPAPSIDPSAQGNTTEFESVRDDVSGTWQITDTQWTSRGLEVRVKITVKHGTLRFSFFALDNVSADQFDPEPTNEPDDLSQGTIAEGQSATGLVVFHKPRNDTTVMLTDSLGRQISALVAKK